MKKIKKRYLLILILLLLLLIWLNNTSLFSDQTGQYKLLAHRGLAQCFDITKVEWDTDTSKIIYPPEHPYLENTIDSIKIAFEYGADVVELDIQATKDHKLALFHDFELSYRTDGQGAVSDHTMDELKLLDIGYGYTADNGKTYPFRGKGIGLMPEEVLAFFPERDLLIHLKDGNIETAETLWRYIKGFPESRLDKITVYGYKDGIDYLRSQSDSLRLMTVSSLKKGLIKYELLGFTGYIPQELHNTEVHFPIAYARLLWGWPGKFLERMASVNTRVVLVDGDGKWSEGFDTLDSLESIPQGYQGYIWTDRIDRISQL